jgi:tRNA uracil 4-sulfurtransferase
MIIVRYAEVGIKGKNRADFERKLRVNVKDCLRRNGVSFERVKRLRGRIVVETDQKCDQLKFVFGIRSFSYAKKVEPILDIIKKESLELYKTGNTFRVTCSRSDKIIAPSNVIEQEVGGFVVEKTGAKVSLREPEQTLFIELFNKSAYVYSEKVLGPGGLPIGTAGKTMLLIDREEAIQAGIQVMKRGCIIGLWNIAVLDWRKLREYEYGFRFREYIGNQENRPLVVSDTVDRIQEYDGFVLRPLI